MRKIERAARYAVVAFIGFGIAMIWNQECQDIEWETLTTGLLAIAAAFITVLGMRETDQKQEKRHEALTRITIRADVQAAQRAAFSGLKLLQILKAIPVAPTFDPDWQGTRGSAQRYAAETDAWLNEVEKIHTTVEASGAAPLFDGYTALLDRDVGDAITSARDAASTLKSYSYGGLTNPDEFKRRVGELESKTHFLRFKVETCAAELKKFGELYAGGE